VFKRIGVSENNYIGEAWSVRHSSFREMTQQFFGAKFLHFRHFSVFSAFDPVSLKIAF
jgi:hypothetical protein